MNRLDPEVARALPDFNPEEWEECEEEREPFILWWRILVAGLAVGLAGLFFWFLEENKRKNKKPDEKIELSTKTDIPPVNAADTETLKKAGPNLPTNISDISKFEKLPNLTQKDEVCLDFMIGDSHLEHTPTNTTNMGIIEAGSIGADHGVQTKSLNYDLPEEDKDDGILKELLLDTPTGRPADDGAQTPSDMSSLHDSVALKAIITQEQKEDLDTFYEMAKERSNQVVPKKYMIESGGGSEEKALFEAVDDEAEIDKAVQAFQRLGSEEEEESFIYNLKENKPDSLGKEEIKAPSHSPIPSIIVVPGSPENSLSSPKDDIHDTLMTQKYSHGHETVSKFNYDIHLENNDEFMGEGEVVDEIESREHFNGEHPVVEDVKPMEVNELGYECGENVAQEPVHSKTDDLLIEGHFDSAAEDSYVLEEQMLNTLPPQTVIPSGEYTKEQDQLVDVNLAFKVSGSSLVSINAPEHPIQGTSGEETEDSPEQQKNKIKEMSNLAEAESNLNHVYEADSGSGASLSSELEDEYLPSMTTAPEIESYAVEGEALLEEQHLDIQEELPEDPPLKPDHQAPAFTQNNFNAGIEMVPGPPGVATNGQLTKEESMEETSERKVSLLEAAGVTSAMEALMKIKTLDEVSRIMRKAGLTRSNLIFGIDYTASNKYQGEISFGGQSLHSIRSAVMNPYQQVITILGKTLAPFATSGYIPAYGFGDVTTSDWSVFPLKYDEFCQDFDEVLQVYNKVTPTVILSGPTNFAPLIFQAMEICRKVMDYHILVIVADGQVTNERATRRAIVDACAFPLSIIVVGVGDGPWDMMKVFDDSLPKRTWDNFHFVEFHSIIKAAGSDCSDLSFAVQSLLEIPDQYKQIKKLGLIKATPEPEEQHQT